MAHKSLEILAKIKLARQNGEAEIEDDILGKLDVNADYTDSLIESQCEQVYKYYTQNTPQQWTNKDLADCKLSVKRAREFNNGLFDPLKSQIFSAELPFDIEFAEPWAIFDFGEDMRGFLSLKGTMDLIVLPDKNNINILELVDYKTGRAVNFATGEEKTYEKLLNDPQLLIYYLAISHLFPQVEQILVTILYINASGAITMCYTKNDINRAKELLKARFEEIKNTTVPRLKKSWWCNSVCWNGKNTFEGTEITPMKDQYGNILTRCQQCEKMIRENGLDWVTEKYTKSGHSVGYYQCPGAL